MHSFKDSLTQAKALTLQGRLVEATKLIQAGLRAPLASTSGATKHSFGVEEAFVDVESRTSTVHGAELACTWREQKAEAMDVEFREDKDFVAPFSTPVATSTETTPASFRQHTFQAGTLLYTYRLFIPSRAIAGSLMPVVVMLHGCKQNAEDFARGTAMNVIAEREKFIVLYPEQIRQANSMGCWNWFEPKHQMRVQGEPAMIATLVTKVIEEHRGDPSRVYVAGLSAGGAMAALVGQLYPEIFAAVGVHSGLAPAAAHDVASAFTVMRTGQGSASRRPIALPVIVFQGSGDKTVAPSNAQAIVNAELDAHSKRGEVLRKLSNEEFKSSSHRKATREFWIDSVGKCVVESWNISSAPHAWAGGDQSGSFTDPHGPSASEAMFNFFKHHAK